MFIRVNSFSNGGFMKSFFKLIRNFFIILIVLILIVCAFVIFKGHRMYSSALEKQDLKSKIELIESNTKYYVSYDNIPQDYINAVVAVEDHRFFEHRGIDFIALARAIAVNVTNLSISQGGSTITQQLSKNLYFTQEQELTRKVAEVFMSSYLEDNLSKEKIFELYVNTAYFGEGYTGLGQAAHGYFNKEPKDLTMYECILLAGVPNAPSKYAPTINMDLCIQRQNQVINAMLKHNYIDENTANKIRSEQPSI